jgi:hypothetical protein
MRIEIKHNGISTTCKIDGVDLSSCDNNTMLTAKRILRNLSVMDRRKYNGNHKRVQQYSKTGIFIKEFTSAEEASRKTQINACSIRACCRGIHKTAGIYQWKFADSDKEINAIGCIILQYSKDGVLLNVFESIADASNKTNITYQNIYSNIKGTSKSAGGFVFKKEK